MSGQNTKHVQDAVAFSPDGSRIARTRHHMRELDASLRTALTSHQLSGDQSTLLVPALLLHGWDAPDIAQLGYENLIDPEGDIDLHCENSLLNRSRLVELLQQLTVAGCEAGAEAEWSVRCHRVFRHVVARWVAAIRLAETSPRASKPLPDDASWLCDLLFTEPGLSIVWENMFVDVPGDCRPDYGQAVVWLASYYDRNREAASWESEREPRLQLLAAWHRTESRQQLHSFVRQVYAVVGERRDDLGDFRSFWRNLRPDPADMPRQLREERSERARASAGESSSGDTVEAARPVSGANQERAKLTSPSLRRKRRHDPSDEPLGFWEWVVFGIVVVAGVSLIGAVGAFVWSVWWNGGSRTPVQEPSSMESYDPVQSLPPVSPQEDRSSVDELVLDEEDQEREELETDNHVSTLPGSSDEVPGFEDGEHPALRQPGEDESSEREPAVDDQQVPETRTPDPQAVLDSAREAPLRETPPDAPLQETPRSAPPSGTEDGPPRPGENDGAPASSPPPSENSPAPIEKQPAGDRKEESRKPAPPRARDGNETRQTWD